MKTRKIKRIMEMITKMKKKIIKMEIITKMKIVT
jgi:hypothetical protein